MALCRTGALKLGYLPAKPIYRLRREIHVGSGQDARAPNCHELDPSVRLTVLPSSANMPERLLLRRNMYEYGVNGNLNLRPISAVC